MKIEYTDNTEVDTDRLNDISAELAEKTNVLYRFCRANNIPIYIQSVDITNDTGPVTFFAKDSYDVGKLLYFIDEAVKLRGYKLVKIDFEEVKP